MNLDAIETYLQQEEAAGPAMSREELIQRRTARKELEEALRTSQQTIAALFARYRRLSRLPDLALVEWAERMLQTPTLAILVIDTTGIQKNSDILRVALVDTQDDIVFDRIVQPVRQPGEANTTYTGIAATQLADAPTLRAIWSELQAALTGRYVLAYNWEWLLGRLRENARAYDLPLLTITGECLMERASRYYGVSTSLKLADICGRIDHVLPQAATAPERAIGQLAFLQAMAQGITNVHVPQVTSGDDDDSLNDLESHPF